MPEIAKVALEARRFRGVGVVLSLRIALQPHLVRQPGQPPVPAFRIAADHGGLDDQRLPLPRRPERALDDGIIFGRGGIRYGRFATLLVVARRACRIAHRFRERQFLVITRRHELGLVLDLVEARHLRERQVFREAARRQLLAGARQDREERAAARMRTPRAAIEPGARAAVLVGDCALERVFEQADIPLRRPHEDRDLVERDTVARFVHDAARDLHALASLAGRGEEADVARRLPFGRLGSREQIPAECDEIAVPRLFEQLALEAERLQAIHRRDVAERHRHERAQCSVLSTQREQRADELEFDVRVDGDVEQEQTGRQLEAGRGKRDAGRGRW
jgi:hypothetical protein